MHTSGLHRGLLSLVAQRPHSREDGIHPKRLLLECNKIKRKGFHCGFSRKVADHSTNLVLALSACYGYAPAQVCWLQF